MNVADKIAQMKARSEELDKLFSATNERRYRKLEENKPLRQRVIKHERTLLDDPTQAAVADLLVQSREILQRGEGEAQTLFEEMEGYRKERNQIEETLRDIAYFDKLCSRLNDAGFPAAMLLNRDTAGT